MASTNSASRVAILDEEGAITDALYSILQDVFSHYASMPMSSLPEPSVLHPEGEISCDELERVERGQPVWDRRRVNEFARKTNGQPLDDPSWVEITTYFDCVFIVEGADEDEEPPDSGSEVTDEDKARRRPAMTLKGFTQMYELQTSAEEAETWKDLKAWGYDERLQKVEQESDSNAGKDSSSDNKGTA